MKKISLEERRAEQKREKEKMQKRLETMQPLLDKTLVPLRPPRSAAALEPAERRPAPVEPSAGLGRTNAEWPPERGDVVEVYSRAHRRWLPAEVRGFEPDGKCKVSYKEGGHRGTKSVDLSDGRTIRWSLAAWLRKYRLEAYESVLREEGYDLHPGVLCDVPEAEVGELAATLGMKRPHERLFRRALLDLQQPRPPPPPAPAPAPAPARPKGARAGPLSAGLWEDDDEEEDSAAGVGPLDRAAQEELVRNELLSSSSSQDSSSYIYETDTAASKAENGEAKAAAGEAEWAQAGGTLQQQPTPKPALLPKLLCLLLIGAIVGGGVGYLYMGRCVTDSLLPESWCMGGGGGSGDGSGNDGWLVDYEGS